MFRNLGWGGKQQVFQHGKHMFGDALAQLISDTAGIHFNPPAAGEPGVLPLVLFEDLMLPDAVPAPNPSYQWVTVEELRMLRGGFAPQSVLSTAFTDPASGQQFFQILRGR